MKTEEEASIAEKRTIVPQLMRAVEKMLSWMKLTKTQDHCVQADSAKTKRINEEHLLGA